MALLSRSAERLGDAALPRRLVLLAGPSNWAQRVTSDLLKACQSGHNVNILKADSRDPPLRAWMGQELDVAVLNARRRRFLDSFGGVCGALRSGGVLILQIPPFREWARERVGARWCNFLNEIKKNQTAKQWITECCHEDLIPMQVEEMLSSIKGKQSHSHGPDLKPNDEQGQLLEAVLKVTASSPLVVVGRRGRGKSVGLGMAAALLLQRTGGDVIVTSPSKDATHQLFQAAERFLGDSRSVKRAGPYKLRVGKHGCLDFVYPDELMKSSGQHRLERAFLIVDEAAGLSVNRLVKLIRCAKRVVLATTLDGYEGSGNGFVTRGLPRLRAARKGLRVMELSAPWRWAPGCPLEALSRLALLLDAAPAALDEGFCATAAKNAQLERIDHAALIGGEERDLRELYGILRHGHYKTKPSDLEVFLDAKGVIWLVLRHDNQNLGLTISGIEDPISDKAVVKQVWLRQRQAPHSLTAQTLSREAGFVQASELRFVRMMRWCLHPGMRQHGLGRRLLSQSLDKLKALEGVDAVAAHFGATAWLIKLWIQQGAHVVFISHGCDPSSGQHSVSVLIPLNQKAEDLTKRLQFRLADQLASLLAGPLHDIDGAALRELLKSIPRPEGWRGLDSQDQDDVWSFAWGARDLSTCRHALVKAAMEMFRHPNHEKTFDKIRDEELVLNLLQGRPILSESQLRKVARKMPWASQLSSSC